MQSQKICTFFLKGSCRNGDSCKFKHDEGEKQKFQANPGFKRRNSDGAVNSNIPRNQQQGNNNTQFQFGGFQKRQPYQPQQPNNNTFQDRPQNQFNNRQQPESMNNNERKPQQQPFNSQQGDRQQQQFNRPQFNENRRQDNTRSQQNSEQQESGQRSYRPQFERNNQYQQRSFVNNDRNEKNNEFNKPNYQSRFSNEGRNNNFARRDFNTGHERQDRFNQNNNTQIVCEITILKNIQGLVVNDFVQSFYIQEFQVLCIVKQNQIAFYKISDKIDLSSKTVVQLPENAVKIYKVWYQILNGLLILIVSYGSKKISLRNVAIYPNIWGTFQHFSIADVSVKDIINCIIQQNILLVFSNDGFLRAFIIDRNKALPPRIYDFQNPIESVFVMKNDVNSNDMIYFIGLKNGSLIQFQDGKMNQIPHELTCQQYALVDMIYDNNNQRVLLLFWHTEEDSSQILCLDLRSYQVRVIFIHSQRISQIVQHKEYLFCSNSLGIIDILKENSNNQYILHSFYPNTIDQSNYL